MDKIYQRNLFKQQLKIKDIRKDLANCLCSDIIDNNISLTELSKKVDKPIEKLAKDLFLETDIKCSELMLIANQISKKKIRIK